MAGAGVGRLSAPRSWYLRVLFSQFLRGVLCGRVLLLSLRRLCGGGGRWVCGGLWWGGGASWWTSCGLSPAGSILFWVA